MKKNILYIFVTLMLGFAFSSCEKTDVDRTADSVTTQFGISDVFYTKPGYEMVKAFVELNGTKSYVITTPFECRPFNYLRNADNSVTYSVTLVLTKTDTPIGETIATENIIASGRMLASQLNSTCNDIVFYQEGDRYKIKINGQDPIEQN